MLRWTISNGSCASSTDDVQITFDATPTTANAGPDQTNLCAVTSTTLSANGPVIGAGLWTITSGAGGSFADATDDATVFNGVAGGTYVLKWTIANGTCAPSEDLVTIRFDQAPGTADAGADIEQCNSGTFTLNAIDPAIGTGMWSIVSGAVTITNPNSFNTTATGVPVGTSTTLRWTVTNGSCASVSDEIVLTNSAVPTTALAGPDQELCSSGDFTLNGNIPGVGTGLWSVIGSANGAAITTPASASSTVTGLTIGSSVTLRWTITSGSCQSYDEVVLTNSATPTTALAGADQEHCNNGTFTMAANAAGVGSGMWTIQGPANGATITNVTLPTTTVTSLTPGTSVTLRWTITNGSCISFEDVVLINNASPTVAIAGGDQNICGSSAVLNANVPGVGTGVWSIISGAGGTVAVPSDPASNFNGIAGNTYVLRWTVTNGICSSDDDVQIVMKRVPDVDAASATICSGNTTNIAITNPNIVPGTTFSWTVQSVTNVSGGSAGNSNLINQTLTVTDGVTQGTIIYRITPTANSCSGSFIDVTVTVNPTPVITTVASDLIEVICSEDQLNFTPVSTVTGTTYSWTSSVSGTLTGVSASGTGTILDIPVNATNTSATITYVVTPSVAGCTGAPVNYVVTVRPKPDVLAADQSICSGQSTSIAITNPNNVTGTTFSWVIFSSTNVTGAIAGSGNNITRVLTSTDAVNTGTVVYRITPESNGCPGDPLDVTVTVTPVPVITNNPSDFSKQICSNETLNFLPTSTIGGTTYSWTTTISGPVSAASVTAAGNGTIADTPVNTGNVGGTVTYRIIPTFNGCNGTPVDLVVNVKPSPSASGADFTICSGQTAFLTIAPSPKNVAGTTFSWTALPSANITGATNGNGSTINQLLTTTNASIGSVTYTITPIANGCAGPVANIQVTVNPIANVNAGADFQVCEPATFPVSGTIGGSATAGTWSVVSGVGAISASTTAGGIVSATYTVGAGDITGSVVLRLTTNDPDAAGPCSIVTDDLIVGVNQRPRVTVPADFVVCEPTSIPLTGNLDPSATAGSWSVLSGSGTLSVSSITGDIVTAAYTPAASDIGNTVSFRLTTNDPDGFGPCTPASDDISITINPSSRVNAGVDFATCEDQPIQLAGSTGGATTAVAWSGGSGASRFSNVNNPASIYNLTPADISAGNITLTLMANDPDGAGPCTTVSDQVQIQINKLPNLILIGLNPAYAENDPVANLSGFPGPGIFTGPGILAGSGQFDPSNAGYGAKTITYTHTDAAGCTNDVSQMTIVNPVTDIEFYIEDPSDVDSQGRLVVCENSGTNDLLRLIGQPEWNDPSAVSASFRSPDPVLQPRIVFDGINGYRLNTRNLPGGTYLIEYIFKNTALATDTLTKVVIVNSAPKAIIDVKNSCIEDVINYQDNSAVTNNLSGGVINKWSWTYGEGGNGNDGVSRNPTYKYTSEGFKTLSLSVMTNQGCQHDTTKVIRVSNPPKPDFTWSKICVETETTEFKDLSNPGIGNIIQYAWDFNDADTLGFGVPGKAVPANTHGGKTSNTYKDPYHSYDNFQVYNVKLTIRTDDGCQNTVTKRIFILDYGKPTPTIGYHENFEKGKGTWVETSSHFDVTKAGEYSWVFGTPSGDEINSAYSGANAWWTGGNANAATDFSTYYQNDSTEVTGPCLDLTGIERPMMSLNYWSHSQENFDGAVVQYSTNGGATWKTIGDAEKRGINWYNSKNIPGAPGGQDNFAWSGKTYGWKNARFNLEEIPVAERDLVVFRIAFGSNSDNLKDSVLNGFAFDDIYIGEKKRTVLVEHFTNANTGNNARVYLDNLFANQTLPGLKTQPDFIKLQYHLANGGFDQLNDDNPTDPATRAFVYGVDTPPTTIMDGILGPSPYNRSNSTVVEFNGDHALVNEIELDRRALDDPRFLIKDTLYATQSAASALQGEVTFTYVDSVTNLTTPVILHTALVEGDISGNRNVVRKLLWESGGRTENRTWAYGDNLTVPIDYTIDVPITDANNLYLVTFVQDKTTRYILQSSIIKAPVKTGLTPVGIEDNPFDAEIRNIHVYPNPASRQINFSLENPLGGNYTYRIIDQRGITILEGTLNRDLSTPQEVQLTALSNGIYFVQFRTQDKVVLYKKIAVMNRH
ncbi:MAG: PKD-like domain-containing protein [Chryseosolibacter sp.]